VQEVLEGIRYRRIDSHWLMQAFFMTLEDLGVVWRSLQVSQRIPQA
jgi:hypothetical protein